MRVMVLALAAVTGAVGLGFLHPFGDPRAHSSSGAPLRNAHIPAAAKTVLMTKCADCHSSETRWPVYSRVPPGSWLIERDIMEAREHLDLSHWDELPADKQEILKTEIAEQAKNGSMPPVQYLAVHWNARLTKADVDALSAFGGGPAEASVGGPGDPVAGKVVFEKRCTGCHAMDTDHEGPRLAGVYGRKAGGVPGYDYSTVLTKSGLTWNDATLDKWLADPDALVPGNNMEFHVGKADERRDLIAYLKR